MKDEINLYDEPLRPQFHFSPPSGWLNDPNGLIFHNGLYHIYYQSIPYSVVNNGDMHWGHASSPDLVHWTNHQTVLYPDSVGKMWSGTAAEDNNGSSGLFGEVNSGIVAAYSTDTQHIGIAYSRDGGFTFTKLSEDEPVIPCPPGETAFRDPHLFYYPEDKKWKMVIAGGPVRIYESPDCVHWTPCGSPQTEYVTECPNLLRMRVEGEEEEKWVLSLCGRDYVVGSFDGKIFKGETEKKAMNDGPDTYAGITFSGLPDGRTVMLSWLNRWWYAKETADGCWNGSLSLPVELHLRRQGDSYRIFQTPVREVETLRREKLFSCGRTVLIKDENPLRGIFADTFEMLVEAEVNGSSAFRIVLRIGDGDRTLISFDPETMMFAFDRSECAGGSEELKTKFNPRRFKVADEAVKEGILDFRIFADRSSIELFIGGGYHYFAARIQPRQTSKGICVTSDGAAVLNRIELFSLESIWGND